MLTRKQAAQMLTALDRVLILCHRNPDGDTLSFMSINAVLCENNGNKTPRKLNLNVRH